MFEQGKFIKESEEFLSLVRSDQVASTQSLLLLPHRARQDGRWLGRSSRKFLPLVNVPGLASQSSGKEAPGLKNDSTSVERKKSEWNGKCSTKNPPVLRPGVGRCLPNDERLFSTFPGFQLRFQSATACSFFPCFCGQGEIVGKCKHLSFSPISSSILVLSLLPKEST